MARRQEQAMTEDHGPYTRRHDQRRDEGPEHIREVLRQFVDEQGWDRRLLPETDMQEFRRINGRRRDG